MGYLRWTPQPVIVTIRDNRDYVRVLLYSYYTTITGWGVLLRDIARTMKNQMETQMEKQLENDMETGSLERYRGLRVDGT